MCDLDEVLLQDEEFYFKFYNQITFINFWTTDNLKVGDIPPPPPPPPHTLKF